MPIIRRSNCVPLPIVVCPVVAVVMLESWVARCVHCVENVARRRDLYLTIHNTQPNIHAPCGIRTQNLSNWTAADLRLYRAATGSVNKLVPDCTLTYTGCPRRSVRDFGRVFLMLNYTDITQNTYIQSWTVTEIMAREVWNFNSYYSLIDYQIHIETGRNMWFL